MHTRTLLLQPPAYYYFEPRGHCPNQTQDCLVRVIRGQTFCPLFVVLKNVCMIKSQFPHQTCKKRMQQITTRYNWRYAILSPLPAYCNPLAYLLSGFFQFPRIYCHPLLFLTGEYVLQLELPCCQNRVKKNWEDREFPLIVYHNRRARHVSLAALHCRTT